MDFIEVNGRKYEIIRLLGKGKGGYSYLAQKDGRHVVVKQIHHEPCDYYQFGNKIQAEINDYKRLSAIGISMPQMLDVDIENERIVKEYIAGDTVYELVRKECLSETCLQQVDVDTVFDLIGNLGTLDYVNAESMEAIVSYERSEE